MFFALLILFFVIFLLTPLSALSRDFVSYSLVVTCNYVITSTSILFKALFYSKVVNNWRRSLTETFSLNFLSFLRQKLSILAFFKLSLSRSLSLYIYLYIHIYIYIYIYICTCISIYTHIHTYTGWNRKPFGIPTNFGFMESKKNYNIISSSTNFGYMKKAFKLQR